MNYIKLFETHQEYANFVSGGTMVKPNVSHCVQENEVHYNPLFDPYNGHAYVDLGLPSGTLWAKMNVGATSETDAGLYFAWGETQGYSDASTKAFNEVDYKFNPSGDGSTFTKYNSTDGKAVLDLEDDAARAHWGGDWHIPTKEQCIELFSGTTNGFVASDGKFTKYAWNDGSSSPDTAVTASTSAFNGTAGHIFFKNSYASVTNAISANDYLFIPAAGYCSGGEVGDVGGWGYVWSSSLNTDYVDFAWSFYFGSGVAGVDDGSLRCIGHSVRGVVGQMAER